VDESAKDLIPILNTMLEEEITVESIILARANFRGNGTPDRGPEREQGLKEESWFVVRKAKMPSVLVEVGF
jgi:N-acetylmuramoyl-L-alanine amidase